MILAKQTVTVKNRLLFMNTGTVVPSGSDRRKWEVCKTYGFVSAGQDLLDQKYICKLDVGNIICAYESGTGYLAVGEVLKTAIPINDFEFDDGSTLRNIKTGGDSLFENADNSEKCEYIARINWFNLNANSLWIPKGEKGHYAPRNTVAELKYNDTKERLEEHFKIQFLLRNGQTLKLIER